MLSNQRTINRLLRNMNRQEQTVADTEAELAQARKLKASPGVIASIQTKLDRQLAAITTARDYLNLLKKA